MWVYRVSGDQVKQVYISPLGHKVTYPIFHAYTMGVSKYELMAGVGSVCNVCGNQTRFLLVDVS